MNKGFAAAAVALSLAAPASGAEQATLGFLMCDKDAGATGATFIVYSEYPVRCTYEGLGGPHTYAGTSGIMFGLDLEYKLEDGMVYLVLGADGSPQGLEGTYVGAKGAVRVGGGVSVQAGLGGGGNGVFLVPAGIGGGAGLGASAGLAYLKLTRAK